MDRFLRELDRAIGALSPAERETALASIQTLAKAAPGIAFVKGISKMAWVALLGAVVMQLSSERPMDQWIAKLQARAKEIGEHVGSLFQSL
jgi:hypothetical protein